MNAQIVNGFVDLEDCKEMIDRLEYLIANGETVKRDDGRIGIINKYDPIFSEFIKKYSQKATDLFQDGYDKYNGYVATKYISGVGMQTHIDSADGEEMGVLMYLNDDYEGGELTYTASDGTNHAIKAKTGDMIYCPSWYPHGVNKVISGNRYFFTVSLTK